MCMKDLNWLYCELILDVAGEEGRGGDHPKHFDEPLGISMLLSDGLCAKTAGPENVIHQVWVAPANIKDQSELNNATGEEAFR